MRITTSSKTGKFFPPFRCFLKQQRSCKRHLTSRACPSDLFRNSFIKLEGPKVRRSHHAGSCVVQEAGWDSPAQGYEGLIEVARELVARHKSREETEDAAVSRNTVVSLSCHGKQLPC
jgi:hypothetical protein